MHFSKSIKCIKPKVNCNVNYGFGVIMFYQFRFISCNKGTSLVGDVNDNEGGFAYVEVVGM